MSEMIERVALAISGSDDPASILGIHRSRARLAIEAMREPTDAMVDAGDALCPIARGTESHAMGGGVVPEDYWHVMIEAALK